MTACHQGHVTPENNLALVPTAHLPHKRAWSSQSWLCLVGYALYTSCRDGTVQPWCKSIEHEATAKTAPPPPPQKKGTFDTVTSTLSCQKLQLHAPSFSSHMLQLLHCSWSHRALPVELVSGCPLSTCKIWKKDKKAMLGYHCDLIVIVIANSNCSQDSQCVHLLLQQRFQDCNGLLPVTTCHPGWKDGEALQKWTPTALTLHTLPRN